MDLLVIRVIDNASAPWTGEAIGTIRRLEVIPVLVLDVLEASVKLILQLLLILTLGLVEDDLVGRLVLLIKIKEP